MEINISRRFFLFNYHFIILFLIFTQNSFVSILFQIFKMFQKFICFLTLQPAQTTFINFIRNKKEKKRFTSTKNNSKLRFLLYVKLSYSLNVNVVTIKSWKFYTLPFHYKKFLNRDGFEINRRFLFFFHFILIFIVIFLKKIKIIFLPYFFLFFFKIFIILEL